jgi:hypothetical protein
VQNSVINASFNTLELKSNVRLLYAWSARMVD